MLYLWIAVMVFAVIIEATTAQLVSIWFAVGGVAALLAEAFHVSVLWQVVLFFGVSILSFAVTFPFLRKTVRSTKIHTNADRFIGMQGLVTAQINNQEGCGLVKVQGSVWSARTADGTVLPENTAVTVKEIQGVKLIVEAAASENK